MIIGGLSQEDVINTHSNIPLLGDIPILGQALSKDTRTQPKTELYIVVTPHIVHRAGGHQIANGVTYVPTTTTTVHIGASQHP